MLGQLADDYLLDFDIFHVSHVTELLHYIDAKYLSHELGGSSPTDVDTWLNVQQHVDYFTTSATKIARRLATFVKVLNKEDLKHHNNNEIIQEAKQLTTIGIYIMMPSNRLPRRTEAVTGNCGQNWKILQGKVCSCWPSLRRREPT